ncbi:putative transcription factor OFP family [Helianthus annuus]|uniref:Transcription repressor n=1 Tax=Helianthus annuus TaxID=4232 RepID=A0A9K3E469_HELAN|nr:putative transcription factor OFP family [Helianthus annuus]KAJ0453016.1 putative transcription factor OFP family [Helianthus annuus]KAJ0458114.1 putative transcription factor OFP family [Helianthus annuus]KAJ0474934.1 putative transcription factor OFP family [Helianthus annuus]KAJ0650489.1 putative transcription factor OFP family [Helianthus annuus]
MNLMLQVKMPTIKKKHTYNTTAVSIGCGSSCRKLNLSKIFNPKPIKHRYYPDTHNHRRHHHHHHHDYSVSSSTSMNTTPTATTATLSPNISDATQTRSSRSVQGFGWLAGDSLAVEKDSSDPYVDFKESMLQMIMEKEIYGEDDLRELLNCFLQLNSPHYHPIIIGAFTEIWNNLSN